MNKVTWAEQTVPPEVALALLESLRAADIPTEHLKHEDVQQSLPRRLGLSPVVEANIRRYAALARDGGSLRAQEVGELLQLVSRRPDARKVFSSTGRRLARSELKRKRIGARSVAGGLPTGVRRRLGLKGVYRIARQLAPAGGVRVESKPPGLVVNGGLLAQACRSDAGCLLLNAAFEESMGIYRADEAHVAHVECEGRGDSRCLWVPNSS
jgi:hypothetical protein